MPSSILLLNRRGSTQQREFRYEFRGVEGATLHLRRSTACSPSLGAMDIRFVCTYMRPLVHRVFRPLWEL